MNWTKVGLKVPGLWRGYEAVYRLNWTKVGLKAVLRWGVNGIQPGLNWTKVGLKAFFAASSAIARDSFELD